jgi:hypothetical protein
MNFKTTTLIILTLLFFNHSYSNHKNIALHTRTGASGITQHQPPYYLTDGNLNSYSQPSSSNSYGFYYEMDLEKDFYLEKIIVHNRFNYRYKIEIFKDKFGILGELTWSSIVDNSTPTDTIISTQEQNANLYGRFIRITNISNVHHAPSISEIEIFEAELPQIKLFETDKGNISTKQNLNDSATISWHVSNYDSIWIEPNILTNIDSSGFLKLSPKQTSSYSLFAKNNFGIIHKNLTIAVDSSILHPIITEFMCSNKSTIKDEDGETLDWIEIYNPNNFSINIKDYYLTDDPNLLNKWKIPSRNIAPKSYLVIFASKKNRKSKDSLLHTNFKLSSDGDYLALVGKDTRTILQEYPNNYPNSLLFPSQKNDISYGINSNNTIGYFSTPTPNAKNNEVAKSIIEEVKFSKQRGVYSSPIVVQLNCNTPNVNIKYTTDGTEPSESNGLLYASALNISNSKTIRAKAIKKGAIPSKTITHSYIFPKSVANSSLMNTNITSVSTYRNKIIKSFTDIPTICLTVDGTINTTTEVKTSVEWIDPIKNQHIQANSGIKYFGGSFTNFAKKSFRLYFRNIYGNSKLKHPLFEGFEHSIPSVNQFDRLDIRSGSHDMNQRGFYMSNRFTDDLMLKAGHLNPHGRFIHLFLNGKYWGQYHLRERWDDDMFAEYFDRPKDEFEAVSGNLNLGGWSTNEVYYAGDGSTWKTAKSLRSNYMSIKNYVDIPQLVDFMLMYMYGNCENEYKAVGTKNPEIGFKFYLNDSDGFTRTANNRTAMNQPGKNHADGPGSIFSMLVKEAHPDFMCLLGDHIQKLFYNKGLFTPDSLKSVLNNRCTEIENSIVAECARWGYHTPSSWSIKKNEYIRAVLSHRTLQVISDFKNAGFYPSVEIPKFSQNGGKVKAGYKLSINSKAPNIYYTLDGSDPRLEGGKVSSKAKLYKSSGQQYLKLIDQTNSVFAKVPTDNSIENSWNNIDYTTDSSWTENTKGSGVGYDKDPTYKSDIDLDVESQMEGKNSSIYLRYEFDIKSVNNLSDLRLNMRYDDGFVAYLNGKKIASDNIGETSTWNSSANSNRNDVLAKQFTKVSLTDNAHTLLQEGKNILAIRGLNVNMNSSDFLIEPELSAIYQTDEQSLEHIQIDSATTIFARAFDGNKTWSPIVNANFSIQSQEVVNPVTDIENLKSEHQNKIDVYPNPFKNFTNIKFKCPEETYAIIEVFDMKGKLVYLNKFVINTPTSQIENINTNDWPKGSLIYRIITRNGVIKIGKMIHLE